MTNIFELKAKQLQLAAEHEDSSKVYTVDHSLFLSEITSILDSYFGEGTGFEIGDLANEIGVLLGKYCPDAETLVTDFQHGLDYGIELSKIK